MAASTAQTTEAAGPAAASRTATTQVRFAATVALRQTLLGVSGGTKGCEYR